MYADLLNPNEAEAAREAKLPVYAQDLLDQMRRALRQAHHARDLAIGRVPPETSGMVLRKRVRHEGAPTREINIGLGEAPTVVVPGAWGSEFHIQNSDDGALKVTVHGDGRGMLHVQHHASNHVSLRNVHFVKPEATG